MAPLASNVEPAFDGHEADLEQYRSVSVTAIVALVLGVLSPLGLLHPVLWAVPMAGIVVSLTALAQLRSEENQLAGRKAAQLGLALCLLFGAASPARYFSRSYFVRRDARRLADEWLGYLRSGDRYKAHQLLYDSGLRAPLDEALPAYYQRNPEQQQSLAGFAAEDSIRSLLALSDQAKIEHASTLEHSTDGVRDLVIEQFRVTDPAGENKDFYVQVSLNRTQFSRSNPGWTVGKTSKTLTRQ